MAEAKAKKEKKNADAAATDSDTSVAAQTELSAEERAMLKDYVPSLKRKYREEIIPAMMKRFNYKNIMQVPRIEKIVVNMGVGEASRDAKILEAAMRDLALITGQKPKLARAKKSISAFKIRTGMPVGCFVTLRGNRMYEFLERLIRISIPRIRDFRGLPTRSFDGRGNHSMGIREHTIFMELDINKVTTVLGMNITTVTTAKTDEEALELLRLFGFPFRSK
jgi:large subunit ribosomal protein L5